MQFTYFQFLIFWKHFYQFIWLLYKLETALKTWLICKLQRMISVRNFSILSSIRLLKDRFLWFYKLWDHFLGIDWNTSHSFLAVSLDFVFNHKFIFSTCLGCVKSECFHWLQIDYFLIFSNIDLLCLKGGWRWIKFFACLE